YPWPLLLLRRSLTHGKSGALTYVNEMLAGLFVGPPAPVGIDAAIVLGIVHHVALERILAFEVFDILSGGTPAEADPWIVFQVVSHVGLVGVPIAKLALCRQPMISVATMGLAFLHPDLMGTF